VGRNSETRAGFLHIFLDARRSLRTTSMTATGPLATRYR
jgi:hypothetical protein